MTSEKAASAAGESLQALAPGRVLTMRTLRELSACIEQRVEFRILWGNSVVVTPEAMEKVYDTFDWSWARYNLLSPSGFESTCGKLDSFGIEMRAAIREKQGDLDRAEYRSQAEFDRIEKELTDLRSEWNKKEQRIEARIFAEAYAAFPGDPRGDLHTISKARHLEWEQAEKSLADDYIAYRKEKDDGSERTADADAAPVSTGAVEAGEVASDSLEGEVADTSLPAGTSAIGGSDLSSSSGRGEAS